MFHQYQVNHVMLTVKSWNAIYWIKVCGLILTTDFGAMAILDLRKRPIFPKEIKTSDLVRHL
jgi:hypothetical protein